MRFRYCRGEFWRNRRNKVLCVWLKIYLQWPSRVMFFFMHLKTLTEDWILSQETVNLASSDTLYSFLTWYNMLRARFFSSWKEFRDWKKKYFNFICPGKNNLQLIVIFEILFILILFIVIIRQFKRRSFSGAAIALDVCAFFRPDRTVLMEFLAIYLIDMPRFE